MDPYLNVFHAYRGAADSNEVHERQLEDNLTRALIVTLDRLQGSSASARLQEALGVPKEARAEPYACELQVQRALAIGGRRCDLVVLHAGPELRTKPSVEEDQGYCGRPDAAIQGDTYIVGIESKLGNTVSESQLRAHWRTLQFPGTMSWRDVTWYAIARAARRAAQESTTDRLAHFLLSQFEEYLCMSGFGGFVEDHFAYFALGSAERSRHAVTKEAIRRTLRHLLDEVRFRWAKSWEVHLGNIVLHAGHAWGTLNPPADGTKKKRPHLTLSIHPEGLKLMANVETVGPHKRFDQAFRRDPDRLLDFLVGLESAGTLPPIGWRFETARRLSGNRPREYLTAPGATISAAMAGGMPRQTLHDVIKAAIRKPASEAVPEIMIRRDYAAADAIGDENLAEQLVDDARALEPFFEWIGEPVR